MKKILFDILNLLKIGDITYLKLSLCEALKRIIIIFFLSIILSFFGSILKIILTDILTIHIFENHSPISFFDANGILYGMIFICLLVPIFEEIIFRLPLKYSPFNLAVSTLLFTYLAFSIILNIKVYNTDLFFILRTSISLILGTSVYIILTCSQKTNDFISNIWLKKRKELFYISVILFGFGHISNFAITPETILLTPILTLPQLVYGLTFGYTRLKYGLAYSILLHMIINTFGCVSYLLI